MSKVIIDLCGGTGSWSKPYRDAGYDVRLVTLPWDDVMSYEPPTGVYGVLAAPPCTEFSLPLYSSGRERDIEAALAVVNRCLSIIKEAAPVFWALENPRGLLRNYLGEPAYKFEHWQYGERYCKPTNIWGNFTRPVPTVKQFDAANIIPWKRHPYRINRRVPGWYPVNDGQDRIRILRAMTPAGFAKAFFEVNQ